MLSIRYFHHLVPLLLALLLPLTTAQARETIPAPQGETLATTVFAPDQDLPYNDAAPENWARDREAEILKPFQKSMKNSKAYDEIGGDDVSIQIAENIRNCDLAIALNGHIYAALEINDPTSGYEVRVYRSIDDGVSFSIWGSLSHVLTSEGFRDPSITVAEGDENRLYVAYTRSSLGLDYQIRMVYADLTGGVASFSSEITVMAQVGTYFFDPSLESDTTIFNDFYLYLVASGDDTTGTDIWFTRSTDFGDSFESPYRIATLAYDDRGYFSPKVCWGRGGNVHVVWYFRVFDHSYDGGIRYRSCPSDGEGGSASWGLMKSLTSNTNGLEEWSPVVAAAQEISDEVMVGFQKLEWVEDVTYYTRGCGTIMSDDAGASWGTETSIDYGITFPGDMMYQSGTGNFILGGQGYSCPTIFQAHRLDPTNWSSGDQLGDQSYAGAIGDYGFALDESQGQRVGVVWPYGPPGIDTAFFDAEWKGDPGYPNMEDGFPVDLVFEPISSPAVVDLDGNGDLEIVFTDSGNNIQVFNHDGTPLSGWPVTLGISLSECSAAIGDLNGDGQMSVVVGTANGFVHCYDSAGNMMPGFPFNLTENVPVQVSIGALGGPYPRTIVCAGGRTVRLACYRGESSALGGWDFPGANITYPAAIGDVNGDGISEIVIVTINGVVALNMNQESPLWYMAVNSIPSAPPTLGDFDLDGDMEVVVPTVDGTLFVKDDIGWDYPNFPVTTSSGSALTSVAIAQFIGPYEPELIVGAENWTVDVYQQTGDLIWGFPQYTGENWWCWEHPLWATWMTFPAKSSSEPGTRVSIHGTTTVRRFMAGPGMLAIESTSVRPWATWIWTGGRKLHSFPCRS